MQGQQSVRQSQGLQQPSAIQNSRRPSSHAALRKLANSASTHRKRGRALHVIEAPERELQTDLADQQRAGPRWTQAEYAGMWASCTQEERYWIEDVEGTIPASLEGTWYRNGPGTFEMGGQPMHVFDGHGLVGRIAFSGGRAHFASRFVRTPAFEEETQQQKVLFRGFGSTKPAVNFDSAFARVLGDKAAGKVGVFLSNVFDIRDKPVANTSLVEWNGKLWALWEAHRPYILHPDTLETYGEETLGGALRENQAFCAHPKLDADTGRMIAFSLGLRFAEGKLHIMELNPDGDVYQKITLPGVFNPITYVHDFMVTKSWYIFHRPPLKVQWDCLIGYLLGTTDQTKMVHNAGCMHIDFDESKAGQWMLISRKPDGTRLEIDTPPQFIWHYASAAEDTVTGKLTIDACVFDAFSPGGFDMQEPSTMSPSTLRRFVVDPTCGTSSCAEISSIAGDFPTVNAAFAGRDDYKHVYMAASTEHGAAFPFQSIVKVDVQSREVDEWAAPNGCFVGEPVFVPRQGPTTLGALHDDVKNSPNGSSDHSNGHSISGSGVSGSVSGNVVVYGRGSGGGKSYTMRLDGNTSSHNLYGDDSHAHQSDSSPATAGMAAVQQRVREDDGYIITPMYDGRRDRSTIVILDASLLAAKPIAQLHLRKPMPFSFHCMWSDAVHGPRQ